MPLVQVRELFYSRVEAPYSPRNSSGYQVVYHSPTLDKATVREIEDQARCFEASQVGTRYQYGHLSTGEVFLTVSQQIDEVNPHITDRAGRPGPFITHALVLDAETFNQIDNNPFLLFDAEGAFVTDVEEMVEIQANRPDRREIEIDVSELEVDHYSFDLTAWKQEMFLRLWDVVADAEVITNSKRSIAVQADDESDIYVLLRLWFAQIDTNARWYLTFNTFVNGCEPQAGTYWMLGSTRRLKQSSAIRIHLPDRRVDYDTATPDADIRSMAEDLYGTMLHAQGLEE